jgi:hypothetical protein
VFVGGVLDPALDAAMTAAPFDNDPYKSGNYSGYDWTNKTGLDYSQITWFVDKKSTQSSTRTREILMTLEREIFPDFAVSITGSYRRYDNFDYGMTYYPATFNGVDQYNGVIDPGGLNLTNLIIDPLHPPSNGPWYVQAGTMPSSVTINYPTNPDGTAVYPWGGAGNVSYTTPGLPFYLPASYYPTTGTPYSVTKKANYYNSYMGVDLVLTKRLSNRWFANASFTYQDQRSYWGTDWMDQTNKWVYDGQPYGQWGGGASGKVSVLMYTKWMAKLSGLYQLPYGFDISGTMNAREGWKIPHYYYMEINAVDAPNPAYYSTWPTIQKDVTDSLPTFVNVTLRLEKKINIGAGRMYLMADVFNIFNSATVNREYDAFVGYTYWDHTTTSTNPVAQQVGNSYNSTYKRLNEILNPRIWRFGARFEF